MYSSNVNILLVGDSWGIYALFFASNRSSVLQLSGIDTLARGEVGLARAVTEYSASPLKSSSRHISMSPAISDSNRAVSALTEIRAGKKTCSAGSRYFHEENIKTLFALGLLLCKSFLRA